MYAQFLSLSMALWFSLSGMNTTNANEPSIAEAMVVSTPVKTIVINSNDQMKFDKTTISVKSGEKIKLTLNHTGELPKNAMGHNFVLLEKGTDIADFGMKAMDAKDKEYIPANGVIVHTKLIGGGESTTIEFTAPEKGTYDFICSFPGHYAMMKGKFIVE